ncbi:MAG: CbbQ/NirQ/NorQ/GpvN family protein [Proteobacteria bacterium]|nr:CbbQ/NirQ/NorQ/GpvN family protein [Pseudomonadota bacterium]
MNSIFYQPIGQEIELFDAAYTAGLALMLKGPTGCGKSRFVAAMAARKKRPLIQVTCNEDTSAADLLWRFLLKAGDTVWQDGPVTRAVRNGAILYLDEIAEAREDVVVALHALTDFRRELYLDRLNETLRATDEFMLIASFNPGYQNSMKELKASTRQRFVSVAFKYPERNLERSIVMQETSCSEALADKLVRFAEKIRIMSELNLKETISTRLLIQVAHLHQKGLALRLAANAAIVHALSDDSETVLALEDLVALNF